MVNAAVEKTLTQLIVTYSALAAPSNVAAGLEPDNADTTLLETIVHLVSEGSMQLAARDYQGALAKYATAESLIYAHIDPQWDPGLGAVLGVDPPRDPVLFDSLLSASFSMAQHPACPGPDESGQTFRGACGAGAAQRVGAARRRFDLGEQQSGGNGRVCGRHALGEYLRLAGECCRGRGGRRPC